MTKIRLATAFALAAAALVAGWIGAWHVIAGRIEHGVDAWAEERRGEGFDVTYRSAVVSGFPSAWRLAIETPAITGPPPARWHWHGAAVTAHITPWSPREIPIQLPGRQRFGGTDAAAPSWTAEAERPNGQVRLDAQGQIVDIELDFSAITLLEPAAAAGAKAARLRLRVTPSARGESASTPGPLNASLVIEELDLPQAPANGLGQRIARLESDATLTGRLPPGSARTSLNTWRESGGTLELRKLALAWGPLELDGNGTLALDERMRPIGASTVRIRGWAETVDALQRGGIIRPADATAAKIALGLLARQPQAGGQGGRGGSMIQIPVSSQDGRLYIAGLPLIRVNPIPLD